MSIEYQMTNTSRVDSVGHGSFSAIDIRYLHTNFQSPTTPLRVPDFRETPCYFDKPFGSLLIAFLAMNIHGIETR
jgi:hypothetical protein